MRFIQSERASAHVLHTLLAVLAAMMAVVTWDVVKNDPRFPLAGWIGAQPLDPYTVTRVLREEWGDDYLRFHATFEKHGCRLDRFAAVGVFQDVTELLPYSDEDGLGDDLNRTAGLQTLRVRVAMAPEKWDSVEFRTRHYCDAGDNPDDEVNKVFHVSRKP